MSTTNGAFAEFTAMDHDLTFRVPDSWSNENAATLPACFFTACQILYLRMGLPEPSSTTRPAETPTVLVWSGATSVGQFVIQLAALSGCRVVTTASRKQWDHLKSLGAAECFDYQVRRVHSLKRADVRLKDPHVVEHLRAATSDQTTYAVDW
jgi:NADPH:quinone reductase-like Zn-dependent oxidoreductase